jgi:hypothetical protein
MSIGPGRLQREILAVLAAGPLTYDALALELFGAGCTQSQRNNQARSIRSLAARGLVEVHPAWWWFPYLHVGLAVGLSGTSSAAERQHAERGREPG